MGEIAVLIGVFAVTFAIGILLILRIPPRLHTPLMSMTNAVSGVTVVGRLVAACRRGLGGLWLALAMVAVVMGLSTWWAVLRSPAACCGSSRRRNHPMADRWQLLFDAAILAIILIGIWRFRDPRRQFREPAGRRGAVRALGIVVFRSPAYGYGSRAAPWQSARWAACPSPGA